MKSWKADELLEQLQENVRSLIVQGKRLMHHEPAHLLQQPAPGGWSVAQVLAHLNAYSRYYHREMEKSLQKNKPARVTFKPGWLGNYFTNMMLPGADGEVRNKMKAPKGYRPDPLLDAKEVVQEFLQHQQHLLQLLEKARGKNIGALRIPVSIAPLIRLKLGDTFRFLIAHEQRHFIQVHRILKQLGAGKQPAAA